jgi:3',5'-cyclic AMP phosphodiesterase CpdA
MTLNLLHLSDVHYESKAGYQDDDKTHVDASLRTTAFRNLELLLKSCLSDQIFDAIIVSGDTTTAGNEKGFESFLKHASPLITNLVQEPAAICVVAGNHDVKWNLDPQQDDYFDQKFASYASFVKNLGATSCLIPTGRPTGSAYDELRFSSEFPGPLYVNHDRRLMILCINSSIRCGEVNTKLRSSLSSRIKTAYDALGSITNEKSLDSELRIKLGTAKLQLEEVFPQVDKSTTFDIPHITQSQLIDIHSRLTEMRNKLGTEWEGYVKIAVFHHHAIPFNYQRPEYKAFELMADAAAVLETLAGFEFQIVLTGHKHQPYVQPITFDGKELLVAGGMTIGGYPVLGYGQGIRHLQIDRHNGHTDVRIANLPCDYQGDLVSRVKQLIHNAPIFTLEQVRPTPRVRFPDVIESAVEEQLYILGFYKANVVFQVEINEMDDNRLRFSTTLSYDVINRQREAAVWSTEYDYDRTTGSVQEVKFNDVAFDPMAREFLSGRGIRIPSRLQGSQRGKVLLRVEEFFQTTGAVRYTSYCPATDLTVNIKHNAPNIEFDPQVHYYWNDVYPVTNQGGIEVHLNHGLLPFQGLQLNWKKKETT